MMSKILSKIGNKKRIAGMKSKWKKSKIGSALMALSGKVMFQIVISMVAHCLRLEADAGK